MSLLDSTKNVIHEFYKTVIETTTSAATESEFLEKGTLTPDEFVIAGDKLCNQCPTWTWEGGDSKKRDYLPNNQQFLQTRNVPCLTRVASLGANAHEHIVENGEWLEMEDENVHQTTEQIADIDLDNVPEIGSGSDTTSKTATNTNTTQETNILANIVEHSAFNDDTNNQNNDSKTNQNTENNNNNNSSDNNDDGFDSDSFEEIPDIETFNDEDNVVPKNTTTNTTKNNNKNSNTNDTDTKTNNQNDKLDTEEKKMDAPMIKVRQEEDTIVKTRTYDVSITWDKYYKVPRIWLRGYDENANPLTSSQIFEDISADHAHKTVTVEQHPHLSGVICAGIHPCRHSEVMKRFMDRMEQSGNKLNVDEYMFLFLKFMSSVIPTIEYDFTHSVDG